MIRSCNFHSAILWTTVISFSFLCGFTKKFHIYTKKIRKITITAASAVTMIVESGKRFTKMFVAVMIFDITVKKDYLVLQNLLDLIFFFHSNHIILKIESIFVLKYILILKIHTWENNELINTWGVPANNVKQNRFKSASRWTSTILANVFFNSKWIKDSTTGPFW